MAENIGGIYVELGVKDNLSAKIEASQKKLYEFNQAAKETEKEMRELKDSINELSKLSMNNPSVKKQVEELQKQFEQAFYKKMQLQFDITSEKSTYNKLQKELQSVSSGAEELQAPIKGVTDAVNSATSAIGKGFTVKDILDPKSIGAIVESAKSQSMVTQMNADVMSRTGMPEAQIEELIQNTVNLIATQCQHLAEETLTPISAVYKNVIKGLNSVEGETNEVFNRIRENLITLYNGETSKSSAGSSSSSGASKLEKGILTGVKALAGVRGLYMLIRKIISQNENLTNGVSNLFATIGNTLEPILNSLANIINFISTSISKLFKVTLGSKKANEETAKNTASFDEINNLSESSSESSATAVNWGDLSGIEKVLTLIISGAAIVGIINLISKLGTLKATLEPIIETVTTFFTSGMWLTLAGIAAIIAGVVISVIAIINYLNDPSWSNFGDILLGISVAVLGLAAVFGSLPLAIAGAIVLVVALVAKFHDQIAEFIQGILDWFDNAIEGINDNLINSGNSLLAWLGGVINSVLIVVRTAIDMIWTFIDGIVTGLKQVLDGIILIFKGDFKSGLKMVLQGIWTMIKGILNTIIAGVEGLVNLCINALNSLLTPLRNVGNAILSAVGIKSFTFSTIGKVSIPRLSCGTNYVAQEGLAYLHQGEAVVPKEYNGRTEELLEKLIGVVESKEFKAYISQKDIGKSAVGYINSQSRIMGGSLI